MQSSESTSHILASVSVKEIFQRVTDTWSLKFVRQRENCKSQESTFGFGVKLYSLQYQ